MKRADVVWIIAKKELSDRLRNRWIWTVSALGLATSLAIAFLGTVPVGVVGARGSGAIMASLLNLSVYLVPLLALVMGAGVIIEEKRRGILDLILAYPVSTGEYFLGTFFGYTLALSIALLASFAPTGIALSFTAHIDWNEYAALLAMILCLGAAFLALSFLISILSRDHARGIASSVLVWIVAVLVFDLVLVGALVLVPGEMPATVFGLVLLLNPTDIFRLLAFSWVGSAASPLGLATVAPPFPPAVLAAALLAWAVVPLMVSHRLFQKRLATDNLV